MAVIYRNDPSTSALQKLLGLGQTAAGAISGNPWLIASGVGSLAGNARLQGLSEIGGTLSGMKKPKPASNPYAEGPITSMSDEDFMMFMTDPARYGYLIRQ